MTSATVLRWSGLTMMISSVLWLVGLLGVTGRLPLVGGAGGSLLYGVAGLLVLIGLIGLLRGAARRFDRRGKAGFVVGYIGALLVALGGIAAGAMGLLMLTPLFLVGSFILFFGAFAIGRSALRARLLPRWNILPLVLSSVFWVLFVVVSITVFLALGLSEPASNSSLNLLPFLLNGAFGASWLALGYGLWVENIPQPVRPAAPSSQPIG